MSSENEYTYSYTAEEENPHHTSHLRPHLDAGVSKGNDRNSFIWSTISDAQAEMTP